MSSVYPFPASWTRQTQFIQPCRLASLNLHGPFFTFQFCKSDVHISLDQKNIPSTPGFGLLTYRELGYSQVPTFCLTHTRHSENASKIPKNISKIYINGNRNFKLY